MRTSVEVQLKWKPATNISEWALEFGEAAWKESMRQKMDALRSTISTQTKAPIVWRADAPFRSAEDAAYEIEIQKAAPRIVDRVTGDLAQALRGIDPDAAPLASVIDPAEAHWLSTNSLPECVYKIAPLGAALCVPCGKDCHKVDGVIYKSCPIGGQSSRFLLRSTFDQNPVSFGVDVRIHLEFHGDPA